ncbi:MAG: arylsulfatase [Planctomycetes bacterium]|nr:arylsulfatase [Planctomycetota bacterium]
MKDCAALWLFVLALSAPALPAAERPNIVLMMADDMGYSDIGCYGGETATPTLDALAADGLRFTQFYNTGRCCPTRASLLTGLYPHQAGIGHMMQDRGLEGYRGDLNDRCRTIAEVLRSAGYATYMAGKWHVTKKIRPDLTAEDRKNWPLQRGFDRFFGTIHGAGSFFDPNSLTRDNAQIPPGDEFYYTDAISDTAAQFIREHEAERPFFLYVAYTAPHWPMHAKPADIDKYKGRYEQGWDALREERYRRMVELGVIDNCWKLSPRDPQIPEWKRAELPEWEQRRMEVYAAMIDCMAQGIGRIVDALEKSGRLDDTLIFFLADNGGCAEELGSRGPVRPDPQKVVNCKPLGPDELQTQMIPACTRDGSPVRQGLGVLPGPADSYIAYGRNWANASNTPFRLYKHWVHEGGISTPLIVHWPAGVAAERRGRFVRDPGHLIDIMATCVDVSGAAYPQEREIVPLEGISLRPAIEGKALAREQPLFWEHEGNRAIRAGHWKLVANGPEGAWELYDVDADRSELNNLAAAYPDLAGRMARQWEEWAERAHVLPWPWGGRRGETAEALRGAATPMEAFESFRKAVAASDWKSAFSYMTAGSREFTVGSFVATYFAGVIGESGKSLAVKYADEKELTALLEKLQKADRQDRQLAFAEFAALVEEQAGFMNDAIELSKRQKENWLRDVSSAATVMLTNLRIEGDRATAMVRMKDSRGAKRMDFKQLNGRWYVDYQR